MRYLREIVDRNRRGDGGAALGFEVPARLLQVFDDLGGFIAMRLDLWRDELAEVERPAASVVSGSGRDWTASDHAASSER